MKKYGIWLLLCAALALCGCGQKTTEETVPQTIPEATLNAVQLPDVLEGEWIAGDIVSKGSVVSFEQSEALADLYETNWADFFGDGSYRLQNGPFTYEGTWAPLELEDHEHFYMLNQLGYTSFTSDSEGLQKSEKTYFAAFLDQEWNVLLIYEDLSEEESPLIYVRDGNLGHLRALMNGGNTAPKTEPKAQTPEKTDRAPAVERETATSGMKNALKAAENYLNYMPFSYTGLIDQLKYEGYTDSEATYAADNCGADWYEQAVRSAENYLEFMAFSRSGLIEQLEYEGYTHDQAVYGVDKVY